MMNPSDINSQINSPSTLPDGPHHISLHDLKKHLNLLVDALTAISPSRNYISQFLTAIPEDYAVIYDGFPEFLTDPLSREKWARLLGFSLGPTIEFLPNSFGKKLKAILEIMLDALHSSISTDELAVFLAEIRQEPIPNPQQEWSKQKIQTLLSDTMCGSIIRQILPLFAPKVEFGARVQPKLSAVEIGEKINVSPNMLQILLDGLSGSMKILQIVPPTEQLDSINPVTLSFNEGRPERAPNSCPIYQLSSNLEWEWINNFL